MHSESNQEKVKAVTCEECGKINGHGQNGTHWICEDCKINEEHKSLKWDNA